MANPLLVIPSNSGTLVLRYSQGTLYVVGLGLSSPLPASIFVPAGSSSGVSSGSFYALNFEGDPFNAAHDMQLDFAVTSARVSCVVRDLSLDLTAPTVSSAQTIVGHTDQVAVQFSKPVYLPDASAFTLSYSSGTPRTITGVASGNGTSQVVLQLSGTTLSTDVFSLVVAASNSVVDLNPGNGLAPSTTAVNATPGNAPVVFDGNVRATTGSSFNRYGLYSDVLIAATPTFWLSEANGNKNNRGTDPSHPIPKSEWSKRTGGLTPSIPIPWVAILDGDASPLQVTFARIPSTSLLWISGVPTLVPGTSTTINTYRSESFATRTPRAVVANALTSATYAGPTNQRLRVVARNSRAWPTSHTLLEAAHTITMTAPYAALPTSAVRVVRPLNATEFATSDTVQVETLPLVGEFQVLGTHLDSDPSFDWNSGNASYAGGDACRILVQDLELGGAPPKSDYSVTPGSTIRHAHGGQGQIWYDGCGVSSLQPGDGYTSWWACRIDNLNGPCSGTHQFYGCLFTAGPIFDGPINASLADCYLDQTMLAAIHGASVYLQGSVGGTSTPNAIFDSSFYGTAIQLTGPNTALYIENNGHIYGTGNTVGIKCLKGAKAFDHGGQLANLLCTANCVNADGTTTGANTTGTFLYGVNASSPATGAGVYLL